MRVLSCFACCSRLFHFLTTEGRNDDRVGGSPFCVLEQDTLHSESTGNTQEVVAPSRHD